MNTRQREEVARAYRQGWRDAEKLSNPDVGMYLGPESEESGVRRYLDKFYLNIHEDQ